MIGTAHVHASDGLHAEVKVLRLINEMFYEVEIISGVGPWNKPGKIIVARVSITGPITPPESDAPAPTPVEAASPLIGTAHVHAADTLHAEVKVLRAIGRRYEVEVISGVGGWSTPGERFIANATIVEFHDAPEAAPVEEPAPLTEPISGEDYITLLLARQAAWIARNHPNGTTRPPLLEWFIQDGDDAFVILPERKPAVKRERTPRVYRSAASLREERDEVQRRIDTFDDGTVPDRAAANLSPYARSKAAARAGRRRFERMDRDLIRFTALCKRLAALNSRIILAEAREVKAAKNA